MIPKHAGKVFFYSFHRARQKARQHDLAGSTSEVEIKFKIQRMYHFDTSRGNGEI
jgi:hypothetical protein